MKTRFVLLAGLALVHAPTLASAQVFEVIHPDVEKGGFEVEALSGVVLGDLEQGEERSAHEFAIGYAPTDFWKTTLAIEIGNPEDESAEYEAFEWENVLLLYGGHHDEGDGHHGSSVELGAFGFYGALEVPNEGGIGEGGAEFGPIAEVGLGPVQTIANLFVEIPFTDGADPGLAYGLSAAVPVVESDTYGFAAGLEAFGGVEGAFGDAVPFDDNSHVIGPALYSEFDVGRERTLEPRLALLFGLTDESPDTALSFNVELKF